MYEVIWDTKRFNNKEDWPEDGKQPFVWSFGDATGFGNHGDYVFGWKDDSLQKILDTECYVNCKGAKTQSIADMNKCAVKNTVEEDIDGWLSESCDMLETVCHTQDHRLTDEEVDLHAVEIDR